MPKAPARTLVLRPADPFDLIRWLARSQSDPRKAVAELVQNSIDARARHVAVERRRLRGGPAIVVRDDGEGILPGLGRDEALRFLATNIGASQKRKLTADERRRLVISGQYGVGLLGFWSIGHRMEIRDATARGTAQKRFPVTPRPFLGERLQLPAELPVPGHPPLRLELYLARGAERPAIQVSCAGTLVADDIAELHALDLAVAPWIGCELAGLLDFAAFTVPPGSRRGVVPDDAAEAFVAALGELRPLVEAELKRLERERRTAADRQVVGELRKALRGLHTRLPQYDLPTMAGGRRDGGGGGGAGAAESGEPEVLEEAPLAQPQLFPPGPLSTVRVVPDPVEVVPGRERRVRAQALDAEGRAIKEGVVYRWSVEGAGFAVGGEGARPAVTAEGAVRPGASGRLRAEAAQEERRAEALATVVAVEPPREEGGLGIPEPILVDAPGQSWRSRFDGQRWEVNQMHEDYLALKGEARARLRYLVALLAKDLAQQAHPVPGAKEASEDVVAILALVERNLRGA